MIKFGYLPGARVYYEGGPTELVKHGVLAEKYGFLSPWVIDAFGRHPAYIAQTVASLDLLTGGRAYLGIGGGEGINTIPYGIDFKKPLTRLKEAIEIIKLLWSSSQEKLVNYQGKIFALKDTYLSPKPRQEPYPPIYIGAFRRSTRELVGEMGDGYLPWINTPETFKACLRDIETGAEIVGRKIADIDMVAFLALAIPEDDSTKEAVENYTRMALVIAPEIAEYHGFIIPEHEKLYISNCAWTAEDMEKISENVKKIPRTLVEKVSASGGVDDIIGKIEAFVESGATHIILANLGSKLEDGMKILGEKVLPYFKT